MLIWIAVPFNETVIALAIPVAVIAFPTTLFIEVLIPNVLADSVFPVTSSSHGITILFAAKLPPAKICNLFEESK